MQVQPLPWVRLNHSRCQMMLAQLRPKLLHCPQGLQQPIQEPVVGDLSPRRCGQPDLGPQLLGQGEGTGSASNNRSGNRQHQINDGGDHDLYSPLIAEGRILKAVGLIVEAEAAVQIAEQIAVFPL